MAEYTCTLDVAAEPAAVFGRLADLWWLSAYVPAIGDVRWTNREEAVVRVDVDGSAQVRPVWVRVYRDRRQLLWGTPDNSVTGELHVLGPHEGGRAVLSVRLGLPGPDDGGIRNALEVVLDRVGLAFGYAAAF
jgi:hypothetical protein